MPSGSHGLAQIDNLVFSPLPPSPRSVSARQVSVSLLTGRVGAPRLGSEFLLVAQGDEGIHASGALGGDVTGQKRHDRQDQDNTDIGEWIICADPE